MISPKATISIDRVIFNKNICQSRESAIYPSTVSIPMSLGNSDSNLMNLLRIANSKTLYYATLPKTLEHDRTEEDSLEAAVEDRSARIDKSYWIDFQIPTRLSISR